MRLERVRNGKRQERRNGVPGLDTTLDGPAADFKPVRETLDSAPFADRETASVARMAELKLWADSARNLRRAGRVPVKADALPELRIHGFARASSCNLCNRLRRMRWGDMIQKFCAIAPHSALVVGLRLIPIFKSNLAGNKSWKVANGFANRDKRPARFRSVRLAE